MVKVLLVLLLVVQIETLREDRVRELRSEVFLLSIARRTDVQQYEYESLLAQKYALESTLIWNQIMQLKIAPENLEVANAYLSSGDALTAANRLGITPDRVHEVLAKSDVKEYVNSVYLDQGYRNRFRLAELLDEIIENKIQEAREAGVYSSKDLVDIIALAHKMSSDATKQTMTIKQQNNVQINSPFGEGNYGKLMEKLLGTENSGS
jgi:hypothetical protein